MKPYSSNYARDSKRLKVERSCASGSRLSIRSRTSVGGKGDALGIEECARISSTCADVPLSTICMSWLAPSAFRLRFKTLLDSFTDALVPPEIPDPIAQ